MAKYAVLPRPDRTDARGRAAILLRVTHKKERAYVTLPVAVRPKEWDEKRERARQAADGAREINAVVSRALAACEAEEAKIAATGSLLTAPKLRDAVAAALGIGAAEAGPTPETDVLAHFRATLALYDQRGQVRTHARMSAVLGKFEAFVQDEPGLRGRLHPEQMTPRLVERFKAALVERHGNGPSTVAVNLRVLRTLVRVAVRDGLLAKDPTGGLVPREKPAEKRRLSADGIGRLAALELPSGALYAPGRRRNAASAEGHLLGLTRDTFLFALYLAGVRFGDVALLRWDHVRDVGGQPRLVYRMGKTDAEKSLLLIPPAAAILAAYEGRRGRHDRVFPLLDGADLSTPKRQMRAVSSANVVVNKYLGKLAERAGIDGPITTHMARHSFADLARQKGWSLYDVSKALGHSSIAVTQRYLASFDRDALDAQHKDLFA